MIQKSITRYLGGLIACNKFDANTLTRREGIAINLIGTNITYKREELASYLPSQGNPQH